MATPRDATAQTIAIEGLRRGGINSPTPSQVARAATEWIPDVLSDIWTRAVATGNTRLRSLEKTAVLLSQVGKRRYDMPFEAEEEFVLTLFSARSHFTVDEDEVNGSQKIRMVDAETMPTDAVGRFVYFDAENPEGSHLTQVRQIIGIDEDDDHVFLLDAAWQDNFLPHEDDTAYIADESTELVEIGIREYDHIQATGGTGVPYYFIKHQNVIEFDVAPDASTYLIQMRYWAVVNNLDYQIEPMPTVFNNWRHVIVRGIQAITFLENGDLDSFKFADSKFEQAVEMLIRRELSYGGQFTGFQIGMGQANG